MLSISNFNSQSNSTLIHLSFCISAVSLSLLRAVWPLPFLFLSPFPYLHVFVLFIFSPPAHLFELQVNCVQLPRVLLIRDQRSFRLIFLNRRGKVELHHQAKPLAFLAHGREHVIGHPNKQQAVSQTRGQCQRPGFFITCHRKYHTILTFSDRPVIPHY